DALVGGLAGEHGDEGVVAAVTEEDRGVGVGVGVLVAVVGEELVGAEDEDAGEAVGVAGAGEEGHGAALAEAGEDDPVGGDPAGVFAADEVGDRGGAGADVGLVL